MRLLVKRQPQRNWMVDTQERDVWQWLCCHSVDGSYFIFPYFDFCQQFLMRCGQKCLVTRSVYYRHFPVPVVDIGKLAKPFFCVCLLFNRSDPVTCLGQKCWESNSWPNFGSVPHQIETRCSWLFFFFFLSLSQVKLDKLQLNVLILKNVEYFMGNDCLKSETHGYNQRMSFPPFWSFAKPLLQLSPVGCSVKFETLDLRPNWIGSRLSLHNFPFLYLFPETYGLLM